MTNPVYTFQEPEQDRRQGLSKGDRKESGGEIIRKKALILQGIYPFPDFIEKELTGLSYEVIFCDDPGEGWISFERELPSLVVLDWGLPDLDAEGFCRKISEHPSGRYVAVLGLNAIRQTGDTEALQGSWPNRFLAGNGSPEMLRGWISAADGHVDLLRDLRRCNEEIEFHRSDLESMNHQLEEAFAKTNQLAVEAELAYLELEQIFKTASCGILVIDADLNIIRANESLATACRLDKAEIEGKKCYEILDMPLCEGPFCCLKQIVRGKRRVEQETERRLPDGSTAHYVMISAPLRVMDAKLNAIVTNFVDITGRVEAEEALRMSEEKFRIVADRAPFGMALILSDQTFEYLNPKFSEVFGYTTEDLPDLRTWTEKTRARQTYGTGVSGARAKQGLERDAQVFTAVCKDGGEKIVEVREAVLQEGRRVMTCVDITDRVGAEEALRKRERRYMELSILDDLTSLYNKRHFNDRLKMEINRTSRYNHPLSILMLDIDDFKLYNDTYGHTKGDMVLARMGEVLAANTRLTDSAYRYGGEEFVVLMPETPGDSAVSVAKRIRGAFESEVFCPTPSIRVHKTVSIGVAEYLPHEGEEIFISRADRKMYMAKEKGKNQVVFA